MLSRIMAGKASPVTNMRVIRAGICALAFAAAFGDSATARDWVLDPARSEIVFLYDRNGKPAQGVFSRVEGEGAFDPAAPGEAALTLAVAIDSIDLGDALENAFVRSADWFDADAHPDAVFGLTELSALVPDGISYKARGDLTIKGVRREIWAPVTLTADDASARVTGLVAFNRRDFKVGVGLSDELVEIGDEVSVRFDLMAKPAE